MTAFAAVPEDRARIDLWTLVDAGLLYAVIAVSSDMLVQLGPVQSLVWLMCYGLALLRMVLTWPYFLAVVGRNRLVLAYPLACLASVLWSYDRGETVVSGLQLGMTMAIGTYLGWRYSLNALLKVLAVVLSGAVILSMLHWATGAFPWPVYTRAGGLAGLFSHKNMLGLRATFAIVAIMAIWLMRPAEAGRLVRLLLVPAMAASVVVLALSQAMTAVLLTPVLAGLLFLLCVRRVPPVAALAALGGGVIALAVGPVLLAILGIDPVEAVLDAVGKSATLTGRTYLWEIAGEVSAGHPFLGVGYGAFWESGAFLNERIATQHAGATTSRSFHNFVLEILVAAGWPALLAMMALILATARRLLRLHAASGSAGAAGALVLLVGCVVASLVGTSLYRGHELMIVLLTAFFVSSDEDLRALA